MGGKGWRCVPFSFYPSDMRKYESELIERALDVVQDATRGIGMTRSPALRLALWVLRPYCDREKLEQVWSAADKGVNPMYERQIRQSAYEVLRNAIRR